MRPMYRPVIRVVLSVCLPIVPYVGYGLCFQPFPWAEIRFHLDGIFSSTASGHVVKEIICAAVMVLPAASMALFVSRALQGANKALDIETRCRKCKHILRGVSEPRCPECGEAI